MLCEVVFALIIAWQIAEGVYIKLHDQHFWFRFETLEVAQI